MKIGVIAAIVGLVAVGSVPTAIADWSRMGAIGVLGAVLIVLLTRTLPAMTRNHTDAQRRLSDVLDGLQAQHHQDQVVLNQTLREMHAHCSGRDTQ